VSGAEGFTRRFIALPGRGEGALAVIEFGPPDRPCDLLFLHANGFNALTYRRVLAPLAGDFRVLAVDQRGHGASTLPTLTEGRENWNDFGEDLVALVEVLDVRGAVFAGHSMGGTACLMAAAATSGRASRLVVFDPVILPRDMAGRTPPSLDAPLVTGASRAAAFAAYHGRAAFAAWPDDMLADYVEAGFTDIPGSGVRLACEPGWEASTFLAQANDPWTAFATLACPARILKAERGSTCRTDAAQAELTADGRVTIETVPGTSHFLPMERPELATDALRLALSGGDVRRPGF
jgi:pimeloyl-ACP methyl ester carboxylesterase